MAVTWTIVALKSNIATGEIDEIHWKASDYEVVTIPHTEGQQEIHRGEIVGSVIVPVNSSSENFIPWADVTEQNAIAWAKGALGPDKVIEIESKIASDIALSKNPVERYDNPWEQEESE